MKKEQYIQLNQKFLQDKKNDPAVKELRGGVLYRIISEGEGRGEVKPRSIVTCHYKGSLINGKVFDNSHERKCPEAFRVNDLISGFQIALVNMHIGDHWEVYIPAEMGYGSRNAGDIPGNSTLIFEIELINIG